MCSLYKIGNYHRDIYFHNYSASHNNGDGDSNSNSDGNAVNHDYPANHHHSDPGHYDYSYNDVYNSGTNGHNRNCYGDNLGPDNNYL